jgi:hypothetical protein
MNGRITAVLALAFEFGWRPVRLRKALAEGARVDYVADCLLQAIADVGPSAARKQAMALMSGPGRPQGMPLPGAAGRAA